MIHKILYCLKSSFQNLRNNLFLSFITTSTITITFIICLAFFLIVLNLSVFKENWVDRLQIIVYFNDSANAATIDKTRSELSAMVEVETITFVSRKEAMVLLQQSLQGQDGILEGLTENPLPASLEIKLKQEYLSVDGVENFVAGISGNEALQDIEYGQKWLQRFLTIFEAFRITSLSLGVCLILFTYFIISNTIKLMIFSRREEIEIMKLVGATSLFIKFPFWIEGIIQGFVGAGIALLFLYCTVNLFLTNHLVSLNFFLGAGNFIFINFSIAGIVLVLGALIGLAGSLFSMNSIDEFNV